MYDLSLFDLRGKAALVTGAAMGIGRACATALAKAGANVAIVDRDEALGNKTAETLRARGAEAFFVRCDVTDDAQVAAMVEDIAHRYGRLDIAVNNAGTGAPGTDLEQSIADWDRVVNLNLTALWLCARAEVQQMLKQSPSGGKIINIASMWGTSAGSNGAYSASKAGAIHLSKSLAVQWGPYNVNVNCISPSWIMTPIMRRFLHEPHEFRRRAREVIPLGHLQRPEDLYGAVMFLASSASDYVTGLNLIVDGGHTLSTWYSPVERATPARVRPDEEVAHLKDDLAAMNVEWRQIDEPG